MAKGPNPSYVDMRRFAQRESACARQAEAERNALKAAIAVAVQQIREWMASDVPLFDPRTGLRLPPADLGDARRGVQEQASEVEALLRRAIGERVIAALDAPETPGDAEEATDGD